MGKYEGIKEGKEDWKEWKWTGRHLGGWAAAATAVSRPLLCWESHPELLSFRYYKMESVILSLVPHHKIRA